MDRQVNYPVNQGVNFVIKSSRCSFFRHSDRNPIKTNVSATLV